MKPSLRKRLEACERAARMKAGVASGHNPFDILFGLSATAHQGETGRSLRRAEGMPGVYRELGVYLAAHSAADGNDLLKHMLAETKHTGPADLNRT